jgi:pimeloyl-ACP methyl ester carboxylesterase
VASFAVVLLTTLIAIQGGSDSPRIAPEQFQAWFDASLQGELKISSEVERRAQGFRYVFVAGFHNERFKGYFARNIADLKSHGVDRGQIHEIAPSSHRTFEENVDDIVDRFHEIAAEGPEPLVIIAHSRGACDALAFALRNAEFVEDHIACMFLVQGPFGGSGAADYVVGSGKPMDRRMPRNSRAVGNLILRMERGVLKRGKHAGIKDLTRDAARDFWANELDDWEDAIPTVSSKTYFITSQAPPTRVRPLHRPIARYVDTYYGPSDGFVTIDDQSLPDIGVRLANVDAAHSELIGGPSGSREKRKLHRAFMETILMAIGREQANMLVTEKN